MVSPLLPCQLPAQQHTAPGSASRHSTVSTLVPNEPGPHCARQTEIHIHRLFRSCRAYELSW